MPANAAEIFAGLYLGELEAAGMPAEALARERALAREAALWVADLETRAFVLDIALVRALGGGFKADQA